MSEAATRLAALEAEHATRTASKRAVIYLRQSKSNTEGIDRQREIATGLVAQRGWQLVGEYADNDTSASKVRKSTTQWGQMLKDHKAGVFDVIVGKNIDRLTRSMGDIVTLVESGATIVTVEGDMDLTTADGEFQANLRAALARQEAARKSERQRDANTKYARDGHRHAAARLFGFPQHVSVKGEPKAEPVPDEQVLAEQTKVRELFAGLDLGKSLLSVAAATGIKPTTARKLALNPSFEGVRIRNGKLVGPMKRPENWPTDPATGELAPWPVVDAGVAGRVRMMLLDPDRRSNGGITERAHLGSGLYRCPLGHPMVAGGGDVPTYRCRECRMNRASAGVDEFVQQNMVIRLAQPDALDAMSQPVSDGDDQEKAVAELESITAARGSIARLVASRLLAESDAEQALRDLARDEQEAREKLARVSAAHRLRAIIPSDAAADFGHGIRRAKRAWKGLTLAHKRALVAAFATVTLKRGKPGRRGFDPDSVIVAFR